MLLSTPNKGSGGILKGCRHILVIKLRYVGDAVWTLPVIENLKRNYPDARISVAINEGSEFVFRNHPDVDTILSFPYRESRKGLKGLLTFLGFVKRMRAIRPDAVIDLTDNDRGAILTFLSGASTRIGYTWRRHSTNLLFNNLFRPKTFSHMVSYHLDLLKDMGLEVANDSIRIADDPVALASLGKKHPAILQDDQLPRIAIHPGARVPLRQWGTEKFARLADLLAPHHRIFIVSGPDEKDILAEVLRMMKTKPEFSSSDLTLAEFTALCGTMDIFVGNDSGPIHIAAAKTTAVGVYGPNTAGWARPWNRDAFVFENSDLACRPCGQANCTSHIYKECLESIDPEMVAGKVVEMLATKVLHRGHFDD
ncbi:glycosyltransferase family 9 protein [Geobacter sp. FeAm09]|uniref:glycosyltransferase family 9 protein n=1 Tax=Geobacter sp. FeAm09 TaxID=2597769 RepID=UPI0011EEBF22|nr:glycosyltransferase family 9 protein [Geobacter sp. FeAm09]QEM67233.1 glycosyltransferase family 9 protein [Geobacter sp. FeAm09]